MVPSQLLWLLFAALQHVLVSHATKTCVGMNRGSVHTCFDNMNQMPAQVEYTYGRSQSFYCTRSSLTSTALPVLVADRPKGRSGQQVQSADTQKSGLV